MKNIKFFISALFYMQMFTACDIIVNQIEIKPKDRSIIGTWYCKSTEETYVFKADSSGILTNKEYFYHITYLVNGSEVEIYRKGDYFAPLTYNGYDTLTFRLLGSNNVFERVKSDEIAGIWYNADADWVFVFNQNNTTGHMYLIGNNLKFDYAVNGSNVSIDIQLSNIEDITITYNGGDTFNYENYVFVRQ